MTNREALIDAKKALTAAAKSAAVDYVAALVASGKSHREIEELFALYANDLVQWMQDSMAKVTACLTRPRTLH